MTIMDAHLAVGLEAILLGEADKLGAAKGSESCGATFVSDNGSGGVKATQPLLTSTGSHAH
jgi:hypothetical protein